MTPALIGGLASRWAIFVRQQRLRVNFEQLFFLTWAGQFFNSILPGSTGGDVVKIYQLCRIAPDCKAAATATVFIDRLSALTALLLMCGVALAVDPIALEAITPANVSRNSLWLGGSVLTVLAASAAWIAYRMLRGTTLGGRINRTLEAAKNNIGLNWRSAAALLLAFALHSLNFLISYCFCRALHLTIGYGQILLMMPVVLFLVMMPITINGHGLRELLLIAYFTHFSVGAAGSASAGVQEIAVATSLLGVANDLLWSVPGGIWYTLRSSSSTRTSGPRKSVAEV